MEEVPEMFKAAVITVSDRCSAGERLDEGGPLVADLLRDGGYDVVRTAVVPDEREQIEALLRAVADRGEADLVVTTGGTGFAPRDITPEATKAVCERMAPGIPEAMRHASMQITNRAMLSRAEAGIRKGTLIVNLPGSPKAAGENLEAVLPALEHGLVMLQGEPADCAELDANTQGLGFLKNRQGMGNTGKAGT
jgi:molybdenum cofactor synthesis domain-containing protein